jgi:NADP-dependent 3-hydroxy acid dehydrogenase YdfG
VVIVDISGKKALVTGASSGIGRSIALTLASNGVDIALAGRSRSRLQETADMISPDCAARVVCCPADLLSEEDTRQMVKRAAAELGGLDYLVNCAGVSQRKDYKVEDIETDDFHRIMRTNVDSLLFCCREAMPCLKESGGAYIINILSTAAFATGAGGGMYSASKYAARALHEAMVAACKGSNIRVSAISPGPVLTNIWSHKTEEITQKRKNGMLRPENIAEIVLFLLRLDPNVHIGNIGVEPWFYKKT